MGVAAASAAALVWMVPFAWMALATLRPGVPADIASLTPAGPFGLRNFAEAWHSGSFPLWYLNTLIVCGGILAVQLVTVTAAGYAFARLTFPGRDVLFALFLLLLVPPLLIVPNLQTLVSLRLYERLLGIMAPYFASAFGTFLMRQTFRTIPRDYEEAAMLEGATVPALIRHVLAPLARPGLAAFAIVSVTAHWNEFLWPLMAVVNRTKVFPPGVSDANACTAYLELAQGPLGQVGSAIGHERAENRAQNRQKPLLPSEA
jgi:sn-glycerol 3-phosphate transport system permease protein